MDNDSPFIYNFTNTYLTVMNSCLSHFFPDCWVTTAYLTGSAIKTQHRSHRVQIERRPQMSIKLLSSYQSANPQSLISSTSVRGSPIEAAPRFVRLRKDTQHSYPSTRLRCTMTDTSLNEGASGIAHKDGVVIVDHGSRRQESNLLLNEFVMMFKDKTGYEIVEPAHMELAEPSIKDAFGSCVQQGANRVIISPFFLFPGRHWHQDIPSLAEAAASEYPGIPYLVTAPLGLHESLVDVVKDRIDYCLSHTVGKVDECTICAGTGRCKIKVQHSKT